MTLSMSINSIINVLFLFSMFSQPKDTHITIAYYYNRKIINLLKIIKIHREIYLVNTVSF